MTSPVIVRISGFSVVPILGVAGVAGVAAAAAGVDVEVLCVALAPAPSVRSATIARVHAACLVVLVIISTPSTWSGGRSYFAAVAL
jgi:hypothetical protein